MLLSEWWQKNGVCASWVSAEVRTHLLEGFDCELLELPSDISSLLDLLNTDGVDDLSCAVAGLHQYQSDHFCTGAISLIKARLYSSLGDYANVIKELQVAEESGFDNPLVSITSRTLLGRETCSDGSVKFFYGRFTVFPLGIGAWPKH